MRSVESLRRELNSLKKQLPQADVEFEVLGIDDVGPDGDDVIIIDLVGASRALAHESIEEDRCEL